MKSKGCLWLIILNRAIGSKFEGGLGSAQTVQGHGTIH